MPRVATPELEAAVGGAFVPGTTYYLSVHSADPGTTGASEFSGGGYARQPIVFAAGSSDGVIASNAAITVPNAGTVAATYFGIWTTASTGTYKGGGLLGSPVTAASISFASGAVTFTAS